jgi:hypothetical protein
VEYFNQLAIHAIKNGGSAQELRNALETATKAANLTDAERSSAIISAAGKAMEAAMEDGVVTAQEEGNLSQLLTALGVPTQALHQSPMWHQVVKSRVLSDIMEGITPSRFTMTGLGIVLQKGETIVWGFSGVAFHESRIQKHYVGASVGMSVRIAKGVYLRTAAFRGHPVEKTALVHMDNGELIITTKHVFFQGTRGVVKIPVRKLAGVVPYEDGIGLHMDSATAKMRIFEKLDGCFAYNVITNLHLL